MVVTPSLAGGGAERHLVRILPTLCSRHVVDIVILRAGGELESEVPSSVSVHQIRSLNWITAAWRIRHLVRILRPRLVLTVQEAASIPTVLALHGQARAITQPRVVISIQNTLSAVLAASKPRTRLRIRLAIRSLYPRTDRVIAVSQGVAKDLLTTWPTLAPRVSVIYNACVDPSMATMAKKPCRHHFFRGMVLANERPEQKKGPPVIVACGRLTAQKDYPTLLQAVARLRTRRPVRLLVLGEGPARPQLETIIGRLGLSDTVDLAGHLSNPYSAMARATVFVLSSRWEGLAMVVSEALACGTPVVATDCPHGPAEILEDGKYGRLVPPGDPTVLAQALEAILVDPRGARAMAERGRQRALDFTTERSAGAYVALLEALATPDPPTEVPTVLST